MISSAYRSPSSTRPGPQMKSGALIPARLTSSARLPACLACESARSNARMYSLVSPRQLCATAMRPHATASTSWSALASRAATAACRLLEHALDRALGILQRLDECEPDPSEPLGVLVADRARERHPLLERGLRRARARRLRSAPRRGGRTAAGDRRRRGRARPRGRAGSPPPRRPGAPVAARAAAAEPLGGAAADARDRARRAPLRSGTPVRGGSRRSRPVASLTEPRLEPAGEPLVQRRPAVASGSRRTPRRG